MNYLGKKYRYRHISSSKACGPKIGDVFDALVRL